MRVPSFMSGVPMANLYQDTYWYPSGALAKFVPARVFPRNSNILAPLWADSAETVPLANPQLTTATGELTFYAAPGDYWIHLGIESFPVTIDSDDVVPEVWHDTFLYEQPVASTSWMVNHNLGAEPDVSVVIAGQVIPADVNYTDLNNLTITFSSPQSGVAYLRR